MKKQTKAAAKDQSIAVDTLAELTGRPTRKARKVKEPAPRSPAEDCTVPTDLKEQAKRQARPVSLEEQQAEIIRQEDEIQAEQRAVGRMRVKKARAPKATKETEAPVFEPSHGLHAGQTLTRSFRGVAHTLDVGTTGYILDRESVHHSLSGAAKHLTGYRTIDGPGFWGVTVRPGAKRVSKTAARGAALMAMRTALADLVGWVEQQKKHADAPLDAARAALANASDTIKA
jgi:hypothetical protein